jgi:hypothetical protein
MANCLIASSRCCLYLSMYWGTLPWFLCYGWGLPISTGDLFTDLGFSFIIRSWFSRT